MPSIKHQPGSLPSSYIVAFSEKKNTRRVIRKQPFRIVRNDSLCQAISFSDNTAVSFYKKGNIYFKGKEISVDKPCLLLVRKGKIFISDPLHKGGVVNITYNKKRYQADLPSDGTTISLVI